MTSDQEPESSKTPETSQAPEASGAAEASEHTETSELHEPSGARQTSEAREASGAPDASEAREAAEAPIVPAEGLAADVRQMSAAERREHLERVSERVALDREVEAEVGSTLLEMRDVTVRFGGLTAVDSVSFDIKRGEILGMIGPNGAGKTTCFNAMTGVVRISSGDIRFEGKSIRRSKAYRITRAGVARTFQNIRLFGEMTALENVVVGADARHRTSVVGAIARLPRHWREEREGVERAMALLEFVGIADRAADRAHNLPYGYQRRLEIARALATEPKLLCLDEPAAGFTPTEKDELMKLIHRIRDDGFTVLLIEHDMRLVMGVTDRLVVLDFGKKIAEGLPSEVREDPAVLTAYLGGGDDLDGAAGA